MPTYEYQCQTCQKLTEIDRPISQYDVPPDACEHCQAPSNALKRCISGRPFILQGYGWARDNYSDYREDKNGAVTRMPKKN